jgi:hypothetical protein
MLSQKLVLVFQLLGKGGIQSTIPHALRFTTQVSGHDFSRAVQAAARKIPCAAGPARSAAERQLHFFYLISGFPAAFNF